MVVSSILATVARGAVAVAVAVAVVRSHEPPRDSGGSRAHRSYETPTGFASAQRTRRLGDKKIEGH